MTIERLKRAATTNDFYHACVSIVSASRNVSLAPERLDGLVTLVAGGAPVSWAWYLHKDTDGIEGALFDFCFNAALNGGYFQSVNGQIVQWQSKGSGSQALLEWIQSLSRDGVRPGIELTDPETVAEVLAPRLAGQPHAAERLLICTEFADPQRRLRLRDLALLFEARHAAFGTHRFGLDHVDALVDIYPAGFGDDPFRKKAILALQMFSGWLHSKGEISQYDLPIPSDYQIPRILAWKGAIKISGSFADALRSGTLLDVTAEQVTELRAAAVLAAHALATKGKTNDAVVDGALFTTFRKDPAFQAESLPPMRCPSLWF